MATPYWHEIYQIIKSFYEEYKNTYVLLIGDTEYIPIPYRDWYNPQEEEWWDIPSDIVYAGLVGDDIIPDVALGRLSVYSEEQAESQVDKIKNYYYYFDQDRMLRSVLISHRGRNPEEQEDFFGTILCINDRDYYDYDPEFFLLPGHLSWVNDNKVITTINN